MISISELKDIATSEEEAEFKTGEAEYLKTLAEYREQIKKAHPRLIKYIQDQIICAMKCGKQEARLFSNEIDDILGISGESFSDKLLCHLFYELMNRSLNQTTRNALNTAMKEEAKIIRKELFEAGIKGFRKGDWHMGSPTIYILF